MRFILVNGRTPRPEAFCVMCDEPIEKSYLREVGTHLIYCDHDCYAEHCQSAFLLLEKPGKSLMSLPAHEREGITDDICRTINPSGPPETSPQSTERTLR